MKRRSFIKKGAAGLTFLAIGAGARAGQPGGAKGKRRRLYGIPDSIRASTPAERNLVRYSLARTDLPPAVWDEVVALAALAGDVFDNPEAALAFSRDPGRYLEARGLAEVTLDPETVEVKTALALGDPEIRRALERDDAERFLQALLDRGLLQAPESSQLAGALAQHIERVGALAAGGASPEACSAVVICAALVLAAVWVWVAAIQNVVVTVSVEAAVTVHAIVLLYAKVITARYMEPETGVLRRQAPFRLAAALGGEPFADRTISLYVDKSVDRIAAAVERLPFYRDRPPLPSFDLRSLIREQLLRQIGGHVVSLPPVAP
jgi:hypothetical protein